MSTAGELMSGEIMSVGVHATLADCARAMRHHNISSLLVLGDGGELLGIITERNLVEAVAAARNPDQGTAESWMTRELITASPQTPSQQLRELMQQHQIRHIPVVEDDRPVGMVSMRDVTH